MSNKNYILVFIVGIMLFNLFTTDIVYADEAENATSLSGTVVNCDYGANIIFTNEDGELSGSFTSNGLTCNKKVSYEVGECPAYVLVQTPYNGTCSVTFSETKRTNAYAKLKQKTEGCFYYSQNVRYTFTRNGNKWNVIVNPDSGRSIDISDSLNAVDTCPETIYTSFPTGNVVHFDLSSGTGNNGSNRNEDPDEARDEDWEYLEEGLNREDFDKPLECSDIIDINDPGSVGWILYTILNYIKIIGPILVVLLSAIDFIKAVVGFDEKAMKEAQSKLVIRLVAAICLFLVPTLVQLLLSFINATTCTI